MLTLRFICRLASRTMGNQHVYHSSYRGLLIAMKSSSIFASKFARKTRLKYFYKSTLREPTVGNLNIRIVSDLQQQRFRSTMPYTSKKISHRRGQLWWIYENYWPHLPSRRPRRHYILHHLYRRRSYSVHKLQHPRDISEQIFRHRCSDRSDGRYKDLSTIKLLCIPLDI